MRISANSIQEQTISCVRKPIIHQNQTILCCFFFFLAFIICFFFNFVENKTCLMLYRQLWQLKGAIFFLQDVQSSYNFCVWPCIAFTIRSKITMVVFCLRFEEIIFVTATSISNRSKWKSWINFYLECFYVDFVSELSVLCMILIVICVVISAFISQTTISFYIASYYSRESKWLSKIFCKVFLIK